MNRKDILGFAEQLRLGPQSKDYRKQWVNFACPWASSRHSGGTDKSKGFGISCDDGNVSKFFCLACHIKGSFAGLAYQLGRLRDEDYTLIGKEIERTEIVGPRILPKAWDDKYRTNGPVDETEAVHKIPSPASEFNFPSAAGHPYLAGRGISSLTAIRLGLRYDGYQRRILFPVYTAVREFVGFSGRAIEGPSGTDEDGEPTDHLGRKYLKVRDYFGLRKRDYILGEHRLQTQRRGVQTELLHGRRVRAGVVGPIVVSEGLIDYAWLAELGYYQSVSLMGSWFSELRAKRIAAYGRPLILFMDNDKAGEDAVEQMTREFWGKVPLFRVEYPSEMVEADPATLPASIVHKMMKGIKIITPTTSRQVLTPIF